MLQIGKVRSSVACSHGRGSLSTMINSSCHKEPVPKDTKGGIQHWCHPGLIHSPTGADSSNYTGECQHYIQSSQTTKDSAAGSSIKGSLSISCNFRLLINSGRGMLHRNFVFKLETVNTGNVLYLLKNILAQR